MDLAKLSTDELVHELQCCGVTDARHIMQTRNGERKKSNAVILTFARAILPKSIKAGYMYIKVEPYIPNPLRCFKCQKFGHHQSLCRGKPICPKCGLEDHGADNCSRKQQCANCNEDHPVYATTCPKWVQEKEICRAKVMYNVSYSEARKMIAPITHTTNSTVSYSTAVSRKQTVSIGTQTSIVNCTCECRADVEQAQPRTSSSSVQTESIAPCIRTDLSKMAQYTATNTTNKAPATTSSINNDKKDQKTTPKNTNRTIPTTNTKSTLNRSTPLKSTSSAGNSPKGGARGIRDSGAAAGRSWKDTGSDPDRVPKGSDDPVRIHNRFASLESMDTIDDIGLPSNEGRSVSPNLKSK
jgi:hypothetical protein